MAYAHQRSDPENYDEDSVTDCHGLVGDGASVRDRVGIDVVLVIHKAANQQPDEKQHTARPPSTAIPGPWSVWIIRVAPGPMEYAAERYCRHQQIGVHL